MKLPVEEFRDRPPLSRPAWGAWIETFLVLMSHIAMLSRPAWGAWIETDIWYG